jgi:glycosyltransferase involved in cell wall biosynthesis
MTAITNGPDHRNSASFRVLVSAYACRPGAGSELGTGWNWVLHLAEAGCELDVFTVARNREANEAFLAAHPMPNLRFHFVEVPWLSPWARGAKHYLLWHWRTWLRARQLARIKRFDLALHVSYGSVHVPTQLWRLGLPTIFGPVGGGQVAPESLLDYFGPLRKHEARRTFLTRLLPWVPGYRGSMRKMRVVLGANTDTMALAKRAGCRDVRLLCDTGLRQDYAADGPRQFSEKENIQMLWVGTFQRRKGLELAFDALQHASPRIHLTLIGDGLERREVDAMLTQRGLADRVHWSGARLGWMEVRDSFRTHDALLFTSLRDSFGSQLLEAMSQGLPIVALSMSGARDFLPVGGGLNVEPGKDAGETVLRLRQALDDFAALPAEQRNRMSETVWLKAQDFAWSRRTETMLEIFSQVMNDK